MANALINCKMGLMKISFGNMTVELNIFNINTQPLDHDDIRPVCLIKEIIDDFDCEDPEIECFTQDHDDLDFDMLIGQENDLYEPSLEDPDMECFAPSGGYFDFSEPFQHDEPFSEPKYELSLEDPELECFAKYGGNIDFCRILEPTIVVVGPSLEDIELESFAQLGDEQYFDEVVKLLTSIFNPMSKLQPECGETMELSFPTTCSSTFEPPDFIFESKWVAPIYRRPRWPRLTLGRNDYFPPPLCDHLMIGLAGYFFLIIDYPSYNHYPFDPGKLVYIILSTVVDVST
jgi:hypothetical protein